MTTIAQRLLPAGSRRSSFNESRVYLASHPLAFVLIRLIGKFGRSFRLPGIGTVVSSADLARAVLLDPRFSKSGPGSAGEIITQVMGPRAILNQDGEEHLAVRRALQDLFAPAYVSGFVAATARPLAEVAAARLAAGEEVDVVRLARCMTGAAVMRMLGSSPEEATEEGYLRMFARGERLIARFPIGRRRVPAGMLAAARRDFLSLTDGAAAGYRSSDGDSIIGRLRGLGFDWEDARGMVAVMILAGTETVSTALPRMVAILVDHGSWPVLASGPALLDATIDEALRMIVPSPVMLRSANEEVELGGRRFRRGERVVLPTYNLARDVRHIPGDPERFDPARPMPAGIRHMWFGHGAHFCLGYPLAKAELRTALEALLAASPDLEIVRRRAARRVLFPHYASLVVRRPGVPA
jgi:cytochrome P450